MTMVGVFVRFRFEEKLAANTTYIYCGNHSSNLDIVLFCMLANGRYFFMGKDELKDNIFLGLFFRTIDVTVARESKISAFRAFKKAGENLDEGMSLIIFPEGKIDDCYPPVLQEFKNGPFKLAIQHKVAIVPISTVNAWQIMWDDGFKYGSKPGIVDVYVHKPILTSILAPEDDALLKAQVFEKINSKL